MNSYPSIYAIGHKALKELFLDPVLVEEKVDGSQFSFGLYEDGFRARSKGALLNIIAPEKMFVAGIEALKDLPLHPGWTYRGEYLAKPKHNTLVYNRIPSRHVIIFDINTGLEEYMSYEDKVAEAERLGLEVVPRVYEGMIDSPETFRAMLDRESILGGQKIEGVVVKNYHRFGPDKKALFGKFVSEAFKEIHTGAWKEANPSQTDVIERIVASLRTPARWGKAVQHLREKGLLEDSPRDIGLVIKEAQEDTLREGEEYIKEQLLSWALPKIRRQVIGGLPEWYKDELVKRQFET